jgi:hypothetical protein
LGFSLFQVLAILWQQQLNGLFSCFPDLLLLLVAHASTAGELITTMADVTSVEEVKAVSVTVWIRHAPRTVQAKGNQPNGAVPVLWSSEPLKSAIDYG